MDMNELLKQMGAFDRAIREIAPERLEGKPERGAACLEASRILIQKFNRPKELEEWWGTHGRFCPLCAKAKAMAERHVALAKGGDAESEVVALRARMDAAGPVELPYAAASDARVFSRHEEMPWIQYHRIPGGDAAGLSAIWAVTWENMLFLLLVGEESALTRWRQGALVRDALDEELGLFRPVAGRIADIIAPGGTVEGERAACLICDISVAGLHTTVFVLEQLRKQALQLLPLEEEAAGAQTLIGELVLSNYPSDFLAQLPEHVEAGADSLTLNAYLRLLLRRSCVPPEACARLIALEWLAEDVRASLRQLMG